MTQHISSRRTALRSIALGAAAPAIFAAVASVPAAAVSRTEASARLDRAIAIYHRMNAQADRYNAEVEMPARRAWGAALKAYPAEPPPPHEQSATSFVNAFGDTTYLSTENIGGERTAWKVVNDPTWADMGDEDWRQAHHEIAAAHDRRNAVLADQKKRRDAFEQQARARFNIDAIIQRSAVLADRQVRLWSAIVAMPVATLGDLVRKIDVIAELDDEAGETEYAAIVTDIRMLAGVRADGGRA